MTNISEPGSPADKAVIDEGRAVLEGMEPAPWLGGFTSWVNISEADAEGIVWLRNHAAELLDRLEAAEGALREGIANQYQIVLRGERRRFPSDEWVAKARALLPESREERTDADS